MRLVGIEIKGFRRFKNTKVNLDNHMIAIVGPNEAGKSSLLQALNSINNDDPIQRVDLTRGVTFSKDDKIIEARFLLNKEEKELVTQFGGRGSPRWYILYKKSNGKPIHKIEPEVRRNLEPRDKAKKRLEEITTFSYLQDLLSVEVSKTIEEQGKPREIVIDLERYIVSICNELEIIDEDVSEILLDDIKNLVNELIKTKEGLSGRALKSVELTINILEDMLSIEEKIDPRSASLDLLAQKCPEILFFDDENRYLSSDYPIDIISNPPASLRNLFDLAEINLDELKNAIGEENHGLREYIEETANKRLV